MAEPTVSRKRAAVRRNVPEHDDATSRERRQRYWRGHRGEVLAALMLRLKGYRIIGRRVTTPAGEIDIVAARGGRIAFVEVKMRVTRAAAEASISDAQRRRVHRAADLWLARHPAYRERELGFDIVFVLPWSWPQHLPNAL